MFFKGLFDLSENIECTLTIMRKNDRLTVSFMPAALPGVAPVVITGTPDDLDAGFLEEISAPVEAVNGLRVEKGAFEETVSSEKVSKASTQAKFAEKARKKPDAGKGKEKPVPDNLNKIFEPNLFDKDENEESEP